MAISPIVIGEGGASVRAKLNAAITQANLVAGKAAATALDAEADARAAADQGIRTEVENGLALKADADAMASAMTAEAAARAAADAQEKALREAGDAAAHVAALAQHARPGEPGWSATGAIDGAPSDVSPLPDSMRAVGAGGSVIALTAGIVAPVAVWRIEPGRQYRLRFVVQRATDTQDPANDAVRLAVNWLRADKGTLSATVIENLVDIAVASGRVERSFTVARADADNVDVVAPAGAVYARPYVRCYGSGVTHVEVIEWTDLTAAVDWSPDVSEFRNALAGLDQRADDLLDRMVVVEDAAAASHDASYIKSGTLADARLSDNVMLRAAEQSVTGVKTFTAALRTGVAARLLGDGRYFSIAPLDADGLPITTRELGFNAAGDAIWTAEGGFKAVGSLIVTDDASIADDMSVGGDATLSGALDVAGAVAAQDGVSVSGGLATDTADVSGALTVDGLATLADADVVDDLAVGGDATVTGALTVTGVAALSSATFSNPAATRTSLDVYNKAYVDALIAAADAMVFKGVVDCSANPNYPAANAGWTYRVSVAGKIGGASGVAVEAGDLLLCLADGIASGTQAAVGASWNVSQTNIDGAVVGPASVTDATPAVFDGASGKLIKNITFAAFKTGLALAKGDVGLGNVDNTSDATKNSAAATLTNKTLTSPVINSPTGIVKGDVGLGNVDNTSDANKPVSTTQQTALDFKAPLAGPSFTGLVGVGTATAGGKLHVALTTSFTWGSPWSDAAAVFGGSAGTSGAVGVTYNDTDGGHIGAVDPGDAWKPLTLSGSEVVINYGGSTEGFRLSSDGSTRIRTLALVDGLTTPSAVSGRAILYVDTADGDLKVIFGDGTIKTIVTD